MTQGCPEDNSDSVAATVAGLAATPLSRPTRGTTVLGALLQSASCREDTAPGSGLLESGGPEAPLLTSHLTDHAARAHGSYTIQRSDS